MIYLKSNHSVRSSHLFSSSVVLANFMFLGGHINSMMICNSSSFQIWNFEMFRTKVRNKLGSTQHYIVRFMVSTERVMPLRVVPTDDTTLVSIYHLTIVSNKSFTRSPVFTSWYTTRRYNSLIWTNKRQSKLREWCTQKNKTMLRGHPISPDLFPKIS